MEKLSAVPAGEPHARDQAGVCDIPWLFCQHAKAHVHEISQQADDNHAADEHHQATGDLF